MSDTKLDELAAQVTHILRGKGYAVYHGREDRSYLTVYKGGHGVSFYMDLLMAQTGSKCPEALATSCETTLLQLGKRYNPTMR